MYKKSHRILTHITLMLTLYSSYPNNAAAIREPRIIGGTNSPVKLWPWMAGLVEKDFSAFNGLFCGASLIAKDWVLTAAHCVNDNGINFDVIVNQAQIDVPGERLAVHSIIIHPDYNALTFEHDIALVKLARPTQTTPIQLLAPYTSQDNAGKSAIALGWGALSETENNYPLTLQQVNLPLISNSLCASVMDDISSGMLCAGDGLGQKDTCFGDSGGPLIVFDSDSQSWRQAGITSWGEGCARPDSYGVYTRVKQYAAFISAHICSSTEMPIPASLNLSIDGNIVRANWYAAGDVSGYRLNYAPYPDAQTIYSIDMNQLSEFSAELNSGSAFYVAITTYKGNCFSRYSNIEHFSIQ